MKSPSVALGLAVGVACISVASILIRLCTLPSLSIAAWRLVIAACFFNLWGILRGHFPWHRMRGREPLLAVAAGFFLALHFASWITSLSYTSVASSVVLVATSPLWVALGGALFLHEPPDRQTWWGLALALAGSAIVGGAAESTTPNGLWGDALALVGAVCGAGYILIGRRLRASVDLVEYVSVVYGAAAVFLCGLAGAAGAPLHGFSAHNWILLLGIAAFPQIIGHSLLNWALRFVGSTEVALSVLGEPVGATLLAWALLGERVHSLQAAGCALILCGVFTVTRRGAVTRPQTDGALEL